MKPDIEIRDALRAALVETLGEDVPELTDDLRFFGDLGLDSTNVIELLMALEDSLGLEIDPDQLLPEAFESVRSLSDYIRSRV
jgi:acyl carrier protein